MSGQRAVTVFGGARIQPGHPDYEAARRLGRLLAEQGLTVVTGGFNGSMEAVSRGAKEAGGRTVGVTVEVLTRTLQPNAWLDQEIQTAALLERIDRLIEEGLAYVVLPGGAGTLAELAVVWNLAILGALASKPILVVGDRWQRVVRDLVAEPHLRGDDLRCLTFVPDVDAAAAHVAGLPAVD